MWEPVALHDKGPALMELCESLGIVPTPWGRCWHAVPGAHPKPTKPPRSGLQDIQACQNVRCPRLKDVSGASHVGALCQPQWYRSDCPWPRSAAAPQLSNEVLPSPGQVGRVSGDEVVGCLTALAFPAGQEEHLQRREQRGDKVELGYQGGPRHCPCPRQTPPTPLSGPSSPSPGVGSTMDTCHGPCPSCPGSAGSTLPCPGALAAAQTPEVHPLPRGEMEPSPPSTRADSASARIPHSIGPFLHPRQDRPSLTTFWREKGDKFFLIQSWVEASPSPTAQKPNLMIEGSGTLQCIITI